MSITATNHVKLRAYNTGTDDSWDGLTFVFDEPDGSPEDISGSSFSFIASDLDGVKLRIAGVVSGNAVTIPFTVTDSLAIPASRIATYVLRQTRGSDRKDRAAGTLTVIGGPPDV